jgi:hypothetical protein
MKRSDIQVEDEFSLYPQFSKIKTANNVFMIYI